MTNTHAVDAALEAMPYGLCVWSEDLTLQVFNSRYAWTFGLASDALAAGMSLRECCRAVIEAGNYFGYSVDELYEAMIDRFERQKRQEAPSQYEQFLRDRSIRTTYTNRPGVGWLVTHEDITDASDHLTALSKREADLARQAMRFETAVDNMAHGLCMIDADHKLVICNANYANLYELPDHLQRPGTLLTDILDYRFENGMRPKEGPMAFLHRRVRTISEGKRSVDICEFENGQIISVIHQPMEDGGWVETHQDITEQRRSEARIHHLARHDALTDLPNRTLFAEEMAMAESRIRRGEMMAVVCFDLDHFKVINDTLGHAVGDALLQQVAARINYAKREHECAARLGGDEFAILAGPLRSPSDAAALAERLIATISKPMEIEGHRVIIGTSVGVAVAPTDGEDGETLMKNADLALYRAKGDGRGNYRFFEKGMDAAMQRRRAIESGLKLGLIRNEFKLVFQPLMELESNRISCMEALLRWEHPEMGFISPVEFIAVAEEIGFIVQLGEWVLQQACRVAATWPSDIRVAVNLSPVQFKSRRLLESVERALEEAGLPASRLELEITESVLLSDSDQTLETLHTLRAMGIRISMDDFGTGYSSLSYLRAFPFDKIKIDRSFIEDVGSKDANFEIIKAVIALGRSLGMSTTAEGVETEAQLDAVRAHGCDEIQGFLFSRPLPERDALELVTRLSPRPAIGAQRSYA
ncbi:EAL domain-containing protein [Pelagibacterium sp. 26DY04]|uniref:putative bifunctional diguanylate cyclase/phosphodiesterase n=1 Tax=Pelagibacterium sp. 26DY04 TaxID=2967130 RepID=UPI0028159965|nr:EAL domain-containing protein [Pelagibacterium sp. 26DY04]WMT88155.1 EAL domain-containing protein [Pelagibacterium sp. 26DY04]